MVEPLTLMSGISTSIDLASRLWKIADFARNAEAKLVVAELQEKLADVKAKLAEVVNENTELKQKVRDATGTGPKVIFRDGMYYKENGDGPFCTTCHDSKNKLIRLTETPKLMQNDFGKWKCNLCQAHYGGGLLH